MGLIPYNMAYSEAARIFLDIFTDTTIDPESHAKSEASRIFLDNLIKKNPFDVTTTIKPEPHEAILHLITTIEPESHDEDWEWGSSRILIYERNKAAKIISERNNAARIIQIKFLDWFYKPICKDGTYGLNCLLAQRLCS
jgi:hypothetical protein